jgi:hypothetical protein
MQERTTVRLPRELLLRAKRKAAAQGRTLTSLIEEGLRLAIVEQRNAPTVKRIMPPVSKAAGGLLPGVNLADSAMLQEGEDLAYVARMKRPE